VWCGCDGRGKGHRVCFQGETTAKGEGEERTGDAYDDQHEVFEHGCKVRVARDGDDAVDERADERPNEAGDALSPAAQNLQAERQGVYVRAVVPDDRQGEQDQTELTETTEIREQYGSQ